MSSIKNSPTQMTDADAVEGQNLGELAQQSQPVDSRKADRRQALSFSFVGGVAALLAACGKYVARFDKDGSNLTNGTVRPKGDDAEGVGTNNTSGTSNTSNTGGPTDPNNSTNPVATATPGTSTNPGGLKPGTCLPVSVQTVDTSTANSGIVVDNPAVESFKLYYGKSSRLLGIKFAAGKVAVGDFIHLVAKAAQADNSGKIVATRRAQSTDVDSSNVTRMVFDTLTLMGNGWLDVVIVKASGAKSKAILNVSSVYNSKDGLEIVDMGSGLLSAAAQTKVYSDVSFGQAGSPNMANTSTILSNAKTLGPQFREGTAYSAAQDNSTWNVSSLVASATHVENIFGEDVKPANASSAGLFSTNNSFAVYLQRSGGGKTYYVRYFFFIG
ncbi:MAG: hypothetical protein ACO3A4_00095 [Silvanigrellaceae bacterium]